MGMAEVTFILKFLIISTVCINSVKIFSNMVPVDKSIKSNFEDYTCVSRGSCNLPRRVMDSPYSVGTRQSFKTLAFYNGGTHQNFQKCLLNSSK